MPELGSIDPLPAYLYAQWEQLKTSFDDLIACMAERPDACLDAATTLHEQMAKRLVAFGKALRAVHAEDVLLNYQRGVGGDGHLSYARALLQMSLCTEEKEALSGVRKLLQQSAKDVEFFDGMRIRVQQIRDSLLDLLQPRQSVESENATSRDLTLIRSCRDAIDRLFVALVDAEAADWAKPRDSNLVNEKFRAVEARIKEASQFPRPNLDALAQTHLGSPPHRWDKEFLEELHRCSGRGDIKLHQAWAQNRYHDLHTLAILLENLSDKADEPNAASKSSTANPARIVPGYSLVAERAPRRDSLPELGRDPDRERQSRYCQGFNADWWLPALAAATWRSGWYPLEPTRASIGEWLRLIDAVRVEYLGPFADPRTADELEADKQNDLDLIRKFGPSSTIVVIEEIEASQGRSQAQVRSLKAGQPVSSSRLSVVYDDVVRAVDLLLAWVKQHERNLFDDQMRAELGKLDAELYASCQHAGLEIPQTQPSANYKSFGFSGLPFYNTGRGMRVEGSPAWQQMMRSLRTAATRWTNVTGGENNGASSQNEVLGGGTIVDKDMDLDELNDRQREALQALYELKAFDKDSRRTSLKVAERAAGKDTAPDLYKDAITFLKNIHFVKTATGRSGGSWLTPLGRQAAEELKNGGKRR